MMLGSPVAQSLASIVEHMSSAGLHALECPQGRNHRLVRR